MALNVYHYRHLDEIPKDMEIVKFNDVFFDKQMKLDYTNKEISKILNDFEKVKIVSPMKAESIRFPWAGSFTFDELSTGCKTLINILQNPDKCIDAWECGSNAMWLALTLPYGNMIYHDRCCPSDIDLSLGNIVYRGYYVGSIEKFLDIEE